MKTLVVFFLSALCLVANASPSKVQSFVVNSGERLSFVFTVDKEGGEAAREQYVNGSFGIGQELGMKVVGMFSISDVLFGEKPAQRLSALSISSPAAAAKMRNSDAYKPLKPLQKQGWEEMEVLDINVKESVHVSLFDDRYYSIAKVWMSQPELHDAYEAAMAKTRAELGIRVLAAFEPTEYSSLEEGRSAPTKLVLVEWPSKESTQAYLNSDALKALQAANAVGIDKIEWYGIQF